MSWEKIFFCLNFCIIFSVHLNNPLHTATALLSAWPAQLLCWCVRRRSCFGHLSRLTLSLWLLSLLSLLASVATLMLFISSNGGLRAAEDLPSSSFCYACRAAQYTSFAFALAARLFRAQPNIFVLADFIALCHASLSYAAQCPVS